MARHPIVVILLALLPLLGCDAKRADKDEIRAVLRQLDDCNNGSDGVGVVDVFTASSFTHNEELLKVGLDGTPAQVKAMPPFDRMEVLRMRLRATRAELTGLDGRGYVRFATSRGWYVLPDADRTDDTLTRFVFSKSGDEAWASIVSDGQRTGIRLHFVRESDQWRYDEPEAMREFDRDLRDAAKADGLSEDDFILDLLEEELGQPVPETVWQPMP